MRTRLIIAVFSFFFLGSFVSSTSAQEIKYDINKYFTPDIVRNSLDLNFLLNENFTNSINYDTIRQNVFNWNLNPTFTRYQNTRKRIMLFSVDGKTDGNTNSSIKSNNNFDKSLYSTNDLSINFNSRFYNSNRVFLMAGLSGNYDGSYTKSINSTNVLNSTVLNNSNNYKLKPSIGFGKGRIETVTDARQAVYVLDELSKKGKITRPLDENEIFNFAQTISRVKNKRFLDARLHKIEEITTVDSFLVANGYLANQDAAYFTTLNDFWEYGALYSRNSGQSFEINISPNIDIIHSKYKSEIHNIDFVENRKTYKAEMNFIYRYEKSAGLNWQHSFSTGLNFHIYDLNYEKKYDSGTLEQSKGTTKGTIFDANYNLSYFPSTRSKLTLYADHINVLDYKDNVLIKNIEYAKHHTSYMYSRIGISAEYYFSPQLRLSGSAGINYIYDSVSSNNTKNKIFSGGIGASITYSFF